jgi:hypothetical protein
LKLSFLKVSVGGTVSSAALMQHTHIVFVPLSQQVMDPT